jgi:hypothetical protein
MNFSYRVKTFNSAEPIWIKELNFKDFRSIVKSQYENDDTSFMYHTNKFLDDALPSHVFGPLTIVDKLLILLQVRATCIGPDLTLKITCDETKQVYEQTILIDKIVNTFNLKPYQKKLTFEKIRFELSAIKAKDEHYFVNAPEDKLLTYTLASSLDSIKNSRDGVNKDFFWESWDDRLKIIDRLPAAITNALSRELIETEKELSANKILTSVSPFTNNKTLEIFLTNNAEAVAKFTKLLFTDDLNNLYTLMFNLVNVAGFEASYIDSISPIEAQLYWMYKEKQLAAAENKSSTPEIPTPGGVVPFR